MAESHKELLEIAEALDRLAARGSEPEIREPLDRLRQAAESVGKAWSGSWLGYHANVYYVTLQTPPRGAHFSTEWGLEDETIFTPNATTGNWMEHDPDRVDESIHELAGNPDMNPAKGFSELAGIEFARQKSSLLSIIEIESGGSESQFLMDQREATTKLSPISKHTYLQRWKPEKVVSKDTRALQQGVWIPPHVKILAQVWSIQTTIVVIASLAEIARQVASHTSRLSQQTQPILPQGTRVFIGHGRSQTWRELKDFLEDHLGLLVDEFNRIPAAGVHTTARLSAMLESAAVAFLVMTGEDEQPDGALRARENVVHEAGLFQGRLGFERAIVLLEEGCDKFSNNAGLGHINFQKGNIRGAFQDVREVLEREGIIGTGTTP